MNAINVSAWAPRKVHLMTLPSGAQRKVRRPGPQLMLSIGRLQRTLKTNPVDVVGKSEEEIAEQFFEDLDDAKELATVDAAIKIFLACMANADDEEYKVVEIPKNANEISPADVPTEDFWYVVAWFNKGCPDIPVQLVEGETDISAVEMFPTERDGSYQFSSYSESLFYETQPSPRII